MSYIFMILISYLFLVFKNSQVIFMLLLLEYLVLGVLFYNLVLGLSFMILFFMIFGVISSVFGLILFVMLIKSFGGEMKLFVVLV